MRIRTQFIITMLMFGIILVIIAASAMIMHLQVRKAGRQEKTAGNIVQGANELSYLANDYLIYRENQQFKRWHSRFVSFSNQVASLKNNKREQEAFIRKIQSDTQRLKEVFDSVESAVRNSNKTQNIALDSAFLQVSWSRMAVQNQGLVSDALRLSQILHQQNDRLREARNMLIYLMVGLFGLFLLASYMLTYRRILKSIAILQAGTAVIGSGNLDFKIEEKKNDEVGDLSHAFNQMTTNLKNLTATKTELEKEMSERMQAEAALHEAHERAIWLARFPEENPNPVVRVSGDGKALYCNPAAAALDEWDFRVGQHIPDQFKYLVDQSMTTGEDMQQDIQLGQRFYIVWITPFPEERYANIYGRDITQRKQTEEALRKSEERLNRAQEIAHLGSWELDLDNNHLTWSDEVYRIFGLQPQEFGATYEAFLEIVHPDDRAFVDSAYSGSVREGRDTYEIEHRVLRRSTGEICIVHERCEHIRDASGRINRSIGMVHDITERKQAEEALRQRTSELQQLTETLEQQVQERTEELKTTNEELRNEVDECQRIETDLKKSESDLRLLSIELLNAQEKERKSVAGEIHDSIGSSLSAIKFKVENALTEASEKSHKTTAVLQSIVPIVQGAIDEARRIQMNLRPPMLDDLGISATIKWLCRQFESTYSNIRIKQIITIEEDEVSGPLKTAIFRILQEGLNNVAKHSKATLTLLLLRKTSRAIKLVIQDYGQGFNVSEVQSPSDSAHSFGLRSMRERTELSGGSFEIKSTQGKGTTIRSTWPLFPK